ncbi:hypothetical protein BDY24DRAFT_384514 [Mrakia frigida]|uniref:uncharacterized protein n=1 Tax=Mrakia frigida TaxID=29902 RepID=UPI003FCC1496
MDHDDRHSSSRRRERSREDRSRRDDRGDDRRSSRRSREEYEERPRHREDAGRGERRRDDGGRRDERRYDDRRDGRYRDEDPYSRDSRGSRGYDQDRGGRGGRDGRDGREMGSPERESPVPEGTIPLSKRIRRATAWDVHAPGFEQAGGLQAKSTGQFQLPGQNRSHGPPMHFGQAMPGGSGGGAGLYPRPGFPPGPGGPGFQALGTPGGPSFGGSGVPLNVARQRKRLYVGNITYDCNEQNISQLFNEKMRDIGFSTNELGEPVVGVQVNHDKSYAFVEFRNPEEATSAMVFDNVVLCNTVLKIRRPKDFVPEPGAETGAPHVPGVISTNVPDSNNKVFVGGLPSYLNDEQVIELLKSFGELKAFNLVKEAGEPDKSKGFAFCEYVDPELTDVAIQGLNNMELGDRYLVVQRASVGANPNRGAAGPGGLPGGPSGLPPIPVGSGANSVNLPPSFSVPGGGSGDGELTSRAIVMLNMVTAEELIPDEDYTDILEDIREECEKYGEVEDLEIPRPTAAKKNGEETKWAPKTGAEMAETREEKAKKDEDRGVGRVYVLFRTLEGAQKGVKAIAGRQFGGRVIICAGIDVDEFLKRKAGEVPGAAVQEGEEEEAPQPTADE